MPAHASLPDLLEKAPQRQVLEAWCGQLNKDLAPLGFWADVPAESASALACFRARLLPLVERAQAASVQELLQVLYRLDLPEPLPEQPAVLTEAILRRALLKVLFRLHYHNF